MDEKEQADRMAAAEALFMISTRVDKTRPISKRGRKKLNTAPNVDTHFKRVDKEIVEPTPVRRGRGRGVRNTGVKRGRGGKSRSNSSRGKGTGSGRGRKAHFEEDFEDELDLSDKKPALKYNERRTRRSSNSKDLDNNDEENSNSYKSKSQADHRRTSLSPKNTTKLFTPSVSRIDTPKSHHAIGFTGAAISIPEIPVRRISVIEQQQNTSHMPVSSPKQLHSGLPSRTMPVSSSVSNLPSMNLTSFTTEDVANLPSIPLEIASLHLSSQPIPNLSSLGDITSEGVMEDDDASDREKSEKFLPLKKRKLHKPVTVNTRDLPSSTQEPLSHSDSEERDEMGQSPSDRYEATSSPAEPVRASFTVQASPAITLQTLLEIKTALTADDDGDLPLHIAVVHENMRMVIKLINLMAIAGKGVDKFNKQQQTPLHLAVKLDFLEAVDILIRSGANVNAVDCTGSSSIHMAVQGRSTKCLQVLLEKCPTAELNARNFDGLTPLHTAVDNGDLDQVELLLKYGADIDVTDGKSGRTSLFRAAESNEKAMVELLLKNGANPDVPNYAGVTTVMAAQGRNLHGVLKLLGSVSTDRFSEVETKPFMSPIRAESPLLRGGNLYQQNTETKRALDKSDETKVFHNVFLVSHKNEELDRQDNRSWRIKCRSEPASPDVKMEVMEESEGERGLLSLPEGILPRGGSSSPGMPQRHPLNVDYRHKLTSHPERKVLNYSKDGNRLELQTVQPVKYQPVTSSNPAAGVDTKALTSNQARLYKKLLEMYNIDPNGPAPPLTTTTLPSSQASAPVNSPGFYTGQTYQQKIATLAHSPVVSTAPNGLPFVSSSYTSPPNTPLNLTKSSTHPDPLTVHNQNSLRPPDPALKKVASFQNIPAGQGVISFRRVASDTPSRNSESPGAKYEMILLPQHGTAQPSTSHNTSTISSLTASKDLRVVCLSQENLKQNPHQLAVPISVPNVSVNSKIASLMKDSLSKRNLVQVSSEDSVPQGMDGLPVVYSLPADKQAGKSYKTFSNMVSIARDSQETVDSTVSTVRADSAPRSSPIFLHQGQEIDLSGQQGNYQTIFTSSGQQSNYQTIFTSRIIPARPEQNTSSKGQADTSQGKIVGFSGAILSVVPSKKEKQEGVVSEKTELKETVQKEFKKRGRKSQKQLESHPTEANLSKINSVTDEKLKKFLGAKKSEGVSGHFVKEEEEKVVSEFQPVYSTGRSKDSTYRTVGIFSGDVQHVRIGRMFSSSPLPLPATPASSSPVTRTTDTKFPQSPASNYPQSSQSPRLVVMQQPVHPTSPPTISVNDVTSGPTISESHKYHQTHTKHKSAENLPEQSQESGARVSQPREAPHSELVNIPPSHSAGQQSQVPGESQDTQPTPPVVKVKQPRGRKPKVLKPGPGEPVQKVGPAKVDRKPRKKASAGDKQQEAPSKKGKQSTRLAGRGRGKKVGHGRTESSMETDTTADSDPDNLLQIVEEQAGHMMETV
ncbi:uncharacterized protein LOC131928459 [Physella acuta]|uniref:uncharacterized protein LOC131928459 n=1 Tax=Physella acuta TaxID=109671 RepID=UPI0027DD4510|nr:uncharacterized protein LOC131928459 [Physella acuta]